MSRCFPFPPPGYEKKPRTDEVDFLKKEKHKERKHKKDKKDKEKREHKEKRERDRSDGKHREKKDRKEKHREKKDKDKEKDGDKGKSSTPGEKNIDGQAEENNVQKLNQKDQHVKVESKILVEKKQMQLVQSQCGEKPFRNGLPAEKNDNAKFVQELDRRIRDDEKGSVSLAVGRILAAGQKNNEQMDKSLDKRIRDDEKGSVSLAVGRILTAGQKNNEQMDKSLAKLSEPIAEKKENILEKRIDYRKMDGQKNTETPRFFGHQVVQSVGANRLEEIARPLEKAGLEEKSKSSKGREEVDKQNDEHKDKNREEKVKTKEKERKKEKKERKSERKSKGEDKFVDSNKNRVPSTENMIIPPHLTKYEEGNIIPWEGIHKKVKEFEANDALTARNIIPPHQRKEDADKGNATEGNLKKRKEFEPNGYLIDPFSSIARMEFEANDALSARSVIPSHQKKEDAYKGNATEGNLKKRKEFEPNGFLIDMDSRPNKLARPSPHGVTDNGRTEAFLVMSSSPSIPYNKQVPTNNLKVNGVIGHQPVTSSSTKSPSPTIPYNKQVPTNNPKVNGVIGHQPVTSSSTKSSSSTSRAKSNHVAQTPTKPPHPDTKYLMEVLSVPETEELVDFDDQGWLFNSGKSNTCKGINGRMMSEGSSRVWDRAMEIESADICALPYVIPY